MDADAAVSVDALLEIGQQTETVTVTETEAALQTQVDTVATHLGEVISDGQIEAIPLNGRSYTDLLAIQPGVSPVTTLTPTSVIMAGVTGTINPSGDLNPGDVSIDGQRESSNGFMVNGIDVQEHMNGGTSVIPESRFDPGVSRSHQQLRSRVRQLQRRNDQRRDQIRQQLSHGDAFEFLRNTDLDARNYFDDAAARSSRISSAA